jgi:hypothetical protein
MFPILAKNCHYLLLALMFCSSCVTESRPEGYSQRTITVASLDMFSQQEPPRTGKSWSGDWQFRRDRLDIVDEALRDIRPDIVVLQNVLRRTGSVSESDELILQSGSLSHYPWKDVTIEKLTESGEDRLLAVAVAKPLVFAATPDNVKNYSQFGIDGHLVFYPIKAEGGTIVVFNVLMPSKIDQSGLWYSLLEEKIRVAVRDLDSCLERVIIAGYLPFEQESRRFKGFLSELGLKDTGVGFCQNAERCQTASVSNGIFLATKGNENPSQVDRIMTHQWSVVTASGANFTRSVETPEYHESYGISRLWASQRYGWITQLRLAVCPEKQ